MRWLIIPKPLRQAMAGKNLCLITSSRGSSKALMFGVVLARYSS